MCRVLLKCVPLYSYPCVTFRFVWCWGSTSPITIQLRNGFMSLQFFRTKFLLIFIEINLLTFSVSNPVMRESVLTRATIGLKSSITIYEFIVNMKHRKHYRIIAYSLTVSSPKVVVLQVSCVTNNDNI